MSVEASNPLTAWPAFVHVALFAVALPLGAWASGRRIAQTEFPPRSRHFAAVIAQQLVFGAIAIAVARACGIQLVSEQWPGAIDLAIGAAFLMTSLAWSEPQWQHGIRERDRRLHLVAPRTAPERVLWTGVALAAGIFEEIAYRGVLFAILADWTGSGVVGAGLAALAFGLAHWIQGAKAALFVILIGLGFQGLVWATGGLAVAVVVHVVFDLIAGFRMAQLADRAGLPLEAPPPVTDLPVRIPA